MGGGGGGGAALMAEWSKALPLTDLSHTMD